MNKYLGLVLLFGNMFVSDLFTVESVLNLFPGQLGEKLKRSFKNSEREDFSKEVDV